MTTIHHINCGTLVVPSYPTVVCHCLLLQDQDRQQLALVDTGIGLRDVENPLERLGQPLIDMAGFQFHESDTAVRRIEAVGLSPADVRHIVLTHGDPDHAGGLADFPNALVHVSEEERTHLASGHFRYVPTQFAHGPDWKTYPRSTRKWFGLKARTVELGFESEVLLIPLFGHTLGHCGVAVQQGNRWLLHVGDAYYLRAELTADDHPVSQLAEQRADDDGQRRTSLEHLRRLVRDHGDEIDIIGYHDLTELPAGYELPRRTEDIALPEKTKMTRLPILRTPAEGRTIAVVGDVYRFLATGQETNGQYALMEAIVPPGGGPPPHVHSREEEGFYILEGEITFTVGEKRIVATAGMFANIPVGTPHSFKNESEKPAKMLITVCPAGLEQMFLEIGVPVGQGTTTASPPTEDEIGRLLAVAPRYGIEILLP